MGHEPEDPAGPVADPGDGVHGTVGVGGELRRGSAVGVAVAQRHLMIGLNLGDDFRRRHELALAVAQGQTELIQTAGEDAGRSLLRLENAPVVPKDAAVVVGQSRFLREVVAVERGNHAQPGQRLKTVADADDQFPVVDELLQLVLKLEFHPVGEDRAGAQMVTEGEPADEAEELKLRQSPFPGDQVVEVDLFRRHARKLAGGGGLVFAVESESGDDQSLDLLFLHDDPQV